MYKLWATIRKDARILARDKVGLIFMFGMPILLVVIVTAIQNSAFEATGAGKMPLLVCNQDTGSVSRDFLGAISGSGMFTLIEADSNIARRIHAKEALVGLVIPADFSVLMRATAKGVAGKALHSFGLDSSGAGAVVHMGPVSIYESPVLQESLRRSVRGGIGGAIQFLVSRMVLSEVYQSINNKPLPDSVERTLLESPLAIREVVVSGPGIHVPINAAQHNVPAWTIFAMFFVVLSLGSSLVREKDSGSFVRLKTLPTSYKVALLSKQLTYLGVTLIQTILIFAIGVWVFPWFSLPALHMPSDIAGLILVTLLCGWCAVSYAICVGVFAATQEQANGFGAVSVVILAVIGGLLVPGFILPDTLRAFMNVSPLHWCLEAYYGLFLDGERLTDVWVNIIPLAAISLILQGLSWWGLRRKNLI
jgi:ABC-2 type transport system permease protein